MEDARVAWTWPKRGRNTLARGPAFVSSCGSNVRWAARVIPRFFDRILSDAPGAVGAYYNAYKTYRWGDPYLRLIASLADRSRLAVDVGAHLGDYTFFMRRHAAGCVAFECNPALVSHLRRRFGKSVDL